MRFAAVIKRQQPASRAGMAEVVRRLVPGQPSVRAQPAAPTKPPPELPLDLDQRVRLIGEW